MRKHVCSRARREFCIEEMEGAGRNSDDFLIIRGQGAEKVAYHEMRGVARESKGFSLIRGWGQQKHVYSSAGRSCALGNVVDVGKCFRFQITRDQGDENMFIRRRRGSSVSGNAVVCKGYDFLVIRKKRGNANWFVRMRRWSDVVGNAEVIRKWENYLLMRMFSLPLSADD